MPETAMLHHPGLADWVVNATVYSLAAATLGWASLHLLRRQPAQVRSLVAIGFLAVLVLVPVFFVVARNHSVHLLGPRPQPAVVEAAGQHRPAFADPVAAGTDLSADATAGAPAPGQGDRAWPLLHAGLLVPCLDVVAVIWLVGVAFMLARLGRSLVRLHGFRSALVRLEDPRVHDVLAQVCAALGVRRVPELGLAATGAAPVTIGLLRPVVVIPMGLVETLSESELRGVLVHEVYHIRGRDHLAGLIQAAAAAVHWWNPVVGVVSRTFSDAREELCDHHAMIQVSRRDYASSLLKLLRACRFAAPSPVCVGMARSQRSLERRIRSIVAEAPEAEPGRRSWALVLVTAGLAALFVMINQVSWTTAEVVSPLPPAPPPPLLSVISGEQDMGTPADASSIHAMIRAGDGDGLAAALEIHPERAAATDRWGTPALHGAAASGSVAMTELLLDHGAPLEARDGNGLTALFVALDRGRNRVAHALLDRGADIGARGFRGCTMLHTAARTGDDSLVRRLLAAGSDPAAQDADGATPLHWAAGSRSGLLVAETLLEAGSPVNARDGRGRTPLAMAVAAGQQPLALLLVRRGADVNAGLGSVPAYRTVAKDGTGRTKVRQECSSNLLSESIIQGMQELALGMIAGGADVDAADDDGYTPLEYARYLRRGVVAEELAARGAMVRDGPKPDPS